MSHPNHYLKKRLISYEALLKMPVVSHLRQKEKVVIHKLLNQHIQAGDKVLEIGCGSGYYTQEILSITPHVTCLEESPIMIEQLKKQFKTINKKIPEVIIGRYPNNTPEDNFDHVVAFGVLDYIEDPAEFLSAATKNAKKSLIFTAVGNYTLGKFGKQMSKLFKIHVFPHSEEDLRQTLERYVVDIRRVSLLKPFSATTLICAVKKS